MSRINQTLEPQTDHYKIRDTVDRCMPWLFFAAAIFVLLYQLGAAALFEPDEGRNAEKAREILVLNDWLTPHENFYPVLDKPIFFYWLIAFSYKLFGISEWAARLPSALAAFGTLGLIYWFTREHWGKRHALWAGLVLLTSAEFFVLARVVIFDMTLTFFLTLALIAFYEASHTDNVSRRRILCLMLYGALAAGTLIKGLIGIVVPGMIIFFYLLLSRQWSILRRIYLIPGTLLFFAIALPWYLQADARNDGYLRYYFIDEHFGRFISSDFDRSQPWYYFVLVGLIGFFPWTLLLPVVVNNCRKYLREDKTLFLVLWVVLPFLFFSLSKSKLPHYILPIFPALAILTGAALVNLFEQSPARLRVALSLTWFVQAVTALYFLAGSFWPRILAPAIRDSVSSTPYFIWLYGLLTILLLALPIILRSTGKHQSHRQCFLVQTFGMIVFLVFAARIMLGAAPARSAKVLATNAVSFVTPTTQTVLYDTYLAGMAFYLRAEKPIWVITHGNKKRTFLGNYYALGRRPAPVTRWGDALLDFDEFRDHWKLAKQPLLVFVKAKNRARLEEQVGAHANIVATAGEYVALSKP